MHNLWREIFPFVYLLNKHSLSSLEQAYSMQCVLLEHLICCPEDSFLPTISIVFVIFAATGISPHHLRYRWPSCLGALETVPWC